MILFSLFFALLGCLVTSHEISITSKVSSGPIQLEVYNTDLPENITTVDLNHGETFKFETQDIGWFSWLFSATYYWCRAHVRNTTIKFPIYNTPFGGNGAPMDSNEFLIGNTNIMIKQNGHFLPFCLKPIRPMCNFDHTVGFCPTRDRFAKCRVLPDDEAFYGWN
jgi:hypothetical protein